MLLLSALAAYAFRLGAPTDASKSPYCFGIQIVGNGPPMVLIPGLACGPSVWDNTVRHYRKHYRCYLLTLPGCDGHPNISAPILPKVRDQLIRFIRDRKLSKPVLFGQDVGGELALWVAAEAPGVIGKVIDLNGEPATLVPPDDDAGQKDPLDPKIYDKPNDPTLAKRDGSVARTGYSRKRGNAFLKAIEDHFSTTEDFHLGRFPKIRRSVLRSSPAAAGQYMYEVVTSDFRSSASHITCPVLAIFTYYSQAAAPSDFAQEWYDRYVHMIPNHKTVAIDKCDGFIMVDQPDWVFSHTDAFLGAR